MKYFANVLQAIKDTKHLMKVSSDLIKSEDWQGQDVNTLMVELLHHRVCFDMTGSIGQLNDTGKVGLRPNFPWVDNHFEERIRQKGVNPGLTYKEWPWYNKSKESLDELGMFNHNYMERYWPNHAKNNPTEVFDEHRVVVKKAGLRGDYGDLNDVISLLVKNPTSRQAYLPVWFPEDTGDANPGRKPCTLGYRFIIRNNMLDITYDIRSCDFFRHFVDDIYLTIKLAQYVLHEFNNAHRKSPPLEPGKFIMNITSLHMFLADYQLMFMQRHPQEKV